MTDKPIDPWRVPPPGHVWQCRACGKRAEDRYGMIGWHDYDWDESCMLNAVAVPLAPEKEAADV